MTARFHTLGLTECAERNMSVHTHFTIYTQQVKDRKMNKTLGLTALRDILRVYPRNT